MPVQYRQWVRRADLRAEPDVVFLFGDNLRGAGLGGQAAECRGEPNAIGVPTKKAPGMNATDFFTDAELAANCAAISAALRRIPAGVNVVIPAAGLGTGRAQLKERAPRTWAFLQAALQKMERHPRIWRLHDPRIPSTAVNVMRPSPWGNPFRLGVDGNRQEVIVQFVKWLGSTDAKAVELRSRLPELRGLDLVCSCAPAACHATVWLSLANGYSVDPFGKVHAEEHSCSWCRLLALVKSEGT